MKFGDVLRELMEEKEITQVKLANDLNLRSSTIGHYVRNEREPDFELLKTRSGITYKDPTLSLSSLQILKNREIEQKNSNLISHTQFLKKTKI